MAQHSSTTRRASAIRTPMRVAKLARSVGPRPVACLLLWACRHAHIPTRRAPAPRPGWHAPPRLRPRETRGPAPCRSAHSARPRVVAETIDADAHRRPRVDDGRARPAHETVRGSRLALDEATWRGTRARARRRAARGASTASWAWSNPRRLEPAANAHARRGVARVRFSAAPTSPRVGGRPRRHHRHVSVGYVIA
jgi:hypothetical protein